MSYHEEFDNEINHLENGIGFWDKNKLQDLRLELNKLSIRITEEIDYCDREDCWDERE